MLQFASAEDYDFKILQAVEAVNESQKLRLLDRLKQHFGSLKGKRIAVWGSRSSRAPTTCARRRRCR